MRREDDGFISGPDQEDDGKETERTSRVTTSAATWRERTSASSNRGETYPFRMEGADFLRH